MGYVFGLTPSTQQTNGAPSGKIVWIQFTKRAIGRFSRRRLSCTRNGKTSYSQPYARTTVQATGHTGATSTSIRDFASDRMEACGVRRRMRKYIGHEMP